MKEKIFTLIITFVLGYNTFAQIAPQLGKDPVKSVIAAMSLDEKVMVIIGSGMRIPGTPPESTLTLEQVSPVVGQTQDLVPGAAGTTHAIPRLGIPQMVVADGPAGLRISPIRANDNSTYYATAFPVGTLLSSTWDADLIYSVGKAMGNEVLEYGIDIILGPGLNIHRNPLCGRNFEYYSEDPLITGKIAAAMINGIESNGVGTSIKHFAANNTETNRNSLNTLVSQRALREIYLKGFSIAVQEAQPWSVMSSYNLINGTYAPENHDLLTKILRNDWGFKGFVMTDWFGGKDAVAIVAAGNDLLMPGNPNQREAIAKAVKEGKLEEKLIDRNIEKLLNIVQLTPRFKGYKFSNKPDLKAHAQIARQVASEGMVLLKNDNAALPFSPQIKKVAAFGNTSYEIITGGTGSGDVNEAYSVALVEGLQNAGIIVNGNLQSLYTAYIKVAKEGQHKASGFMMRTIPVKELIINDDIAESMVNVSDAAIITIGRNSGEGFDRKAVEGDFYLTSTEQDLIKSVCATYHAKSKKVIVILNTGGVIETASWKNQPDAILLAWQAGQETGNSIADILCGKINPSGKLASSFPMNYEDVSSAKNFPGKVIGEAPKKEEDDMMSAFMSPQPAEITYEEGIYVGYRYYNTFKIPVSYEFGYGLSYTTFKISGIKLSSTKFSRSLAVTANVTNTGAVAGREVIQLYLSAPATRLDKPESELKGFTKTKLLQPDETQTITIVLDPMSLASFDTQTSSWVADAGKYTVKVGSSSKNISQTATFGLGKNITVKKESNALAPQVNMNELKP